MKKIIFLGLILTALLVAGCIQQTPRQTPANCNGHNLGETWKSDDNCNTCSCDEIGTTCTAMACIKNECNSAADCENSGLIHNKCRGEWNCQNNKCEWACDEKEWCTPEWCEEILGSYPHDCEGELQCISNQCVWSCDTESVKCIEEGGTIPTANRKLCTFSDNSYCNKKDFLEGKCSKGENLMKCSASGSESDGYWNADTNEFLFWGNC